MRNAIVITASFKSTGRVEEKFMKNYWENHRAGKFEKSNSFHQENSSLSFLFFFPFERKKKWKRKCVKAYLKCGYAVQVFDDFILCINLAVLLWDTAYVQAHVWVSCALFKAKI